MVKTFDILSILGAGIGCITVAGFIVLISVTILQFTLRLFIK